MKPNVASTPCRVGATILSILLRRRTRVELTEAQVAQQKNRKLDPLTMVTWARKSPWMLKATVMICLDMPAGRHVEELGPEGPSSSHWMPRRYMTEEEKKRMNYEIIEPRKLLQGAGSHEKGKGKLKPRGKGQLLYFL